MSEERGISVFIDYDFIPCQYFVYGQSVLLGEAEIAHVIFENAVVCVVFVCNAVKPYGIFVFRTDDTPVPVVVVKQKKDLLTMLVCQLTTELRGIAGVVELNRTAEHIDPITRTFRSDLNAGKGLFIPGIHDLEFVFGLT